MPLRLLRLAIYRHKPRRRARIDRAKRGAKGFGLAMKFRDLYRKLRRITVSNVPKPVVLLLGCDWASSKRAMCKRLLLPNRFADPTRHGL